MIRLKKFLPDFLTPNRLTRVTFWSSCYFVDIIPSRFIDFVSKENFDSLAGILTDGYLYLSLVVYNDFI